MNTENNFGEEQEQNTEIQKPDSKEFQKILYEGIPFEQLPEKKEDQIDVYNIDEEIKLVDIAKEAKNWEKEKEVSKTIEKEGIYEDEKIMIVTPTYYIERLEPKFNGKQVFISRYGKLEIPRPDTSYIHKGEYLPFQYNKDNNEIDIYEVNGHPIKTDNENIPVCNSTELTYKLKTIMETVPTEENIKELQEFLLLYLKNPKEISYDGHSRWKHGFDAVLAVKLLYNRTNKEHLDKQYYESGWQLRHNKQVLNYVISTKEYISIPPEQQPTHLIHTEIAKEIANNIKVKTNKAFQNITPERKDQYLKDTGKQLDEWIEGFSNGNEILKEVLFQEIRYLLNNDYNLSYNAYNLYNINDLDVIFSKINQPKNTEGKDIERIFTKQRNREDSDILQMFDFENKVDQLITYLKNKHVDKETIELLQLSGKSGRTVKPIVVLKGIVNTKSDTEPPFYPTSSITTSFVKENFNQHLIKCSLQSAKPISMSTNSGVKSRQAFNTILNSIHNKVENTETGNVDATDIEKILKDESISRDEKTEILSSIVKNIDMIEVQNIKKQIKDKIPQDIKDEYAGLTEKEDRELKDIPRYKIKTTEDVNNVIKDIVWKRLDDSQLYQSFKKLCKNEIFYKRFNEIVKNDELDSIYEGIENMVMDDEEVLNMPNFEEIMENTKNRTKGLENIHRRLEQLHLLKEVELIDKAKDYTDWVKYLLEDGVKHVSLLEENWCKLLEKEYLKILGIDKKNFDDFVAYAKSK